MSDQRVSNITGCDEAVAVIADKNFYEGMSLANKIAAQGGDIAAHAAARGVPSPTLYRSALRLLAEAHKDG